MTRRILIAVSLLLVAGLLAIQLVPYRVQNRPVVQEPAWDSPQTRVLAERACFDCHSNQTKVPWYGQVAPVAWLVRDHVDEGRQAMNLSEMHRLQEEAHEAAEELLEGEMPPRYYTLLHPEARLSASERDLLVTGLQATLGGEGEDHRVGRRHSQSRDHEWDDDKEWEDEDDD